MAHTYEQLDELVDTDPIKLRDVAWAAVRKVEALEARVAQLERADKS